MKINLCKFCICWAFFINLILNANNKNFVAKTKTTTVSTKNFSPQVYPFIKFLCVCPRDYEYENVVKALQPYKYNKSFIKTNNVDKKVSLKTLCKQLSVEHGKVDFFEIENNVICVLEGGKRQHSISFTLGNAIALLGKHLKLIIVGGICGCSDNSIKVGSIMIPSCFYSLDAFTVCNLSSQRNIPLIRKDKTSIANFECFSLQQEGSSINVSQDFNATRDKIVNLLDEAYDCINFTSGCFIDNSHFCMNLVDYFNIKEKEPINPLPHIFEMEDFASMEICSNRKIPCICIRAVSDHAGQNKASENEEDVFKDYSSNTITDCKVFASKKLGKALEKIFKNINL